MTCGDFPDLPGRFSLFLGQMTLRLRQVLRPGQAYQIMIIVPEGHDPPEFVITALGKVERSRQPEKSVLG